MAEPMYLFFGRDERQSWDQLILRGELQSPPLDWAGIRQHRRISGDIVIQPGRANLWHMVRPDGWAFEWEKGNPQCYINQLWESYRQGHLAIVVEGFNWPMNKYHQEVVTVW